MSGVGIVGCGFGDSGFGVLGLCLDVGLSMRKPLYS